MYTDARLNLAFYFSVHSEDCNLLSTATVLQKGYSRFLPDTLTLDWTTAGRSATPGAIVSECTPTYCPSCPQVL